jgi:hypothetical protein
MGRRHTGTLPVPRLHAKTGHARVYINGKEYWLGKFGSPEAQLKYDELVASYLASGRKSVKPPPESPPATPAPATTVASPPAADITVGEVSLRWLRHVEATRGSKSSTYTAGLAAARALRDVRALPAREFGPRRLIEVRMAFASTPVVHRNKKGKVTSTKPRTRRYVNKRDDRRRDITEHLGVQRLEYLCGGHHDSGWRQTPDERSDLTQTDDVVRLSRWLRHLRW